jgi:hypothetical protein
LKGKQEEKIWENKVERRRKERKRRGKKKKKDTKQAHQTYLKRKSVGVRGRRKKERREDERKKGKGLAGHLCLPAMRLLDVFTVDTSRSY